MNELKLSDNLNQIEMEINYHKNLAGQSIWEIGKRLNHVSDFTKREVRMTPKQVELMANEQKVKEQFDD